VFQSKRNKAAAHIKVVSSEEFDIWVGKKCQGK